VRKFTYIDMASMVVITEIGSTFTLVRLFEVQCFCYHMPKILKLQSLLE